MIQEVFDLTVSEIIMEIMNGAPQYWKVLIDTSRIVTIADLQSYIKYHEESLMRNPDTQTQDLERRLKALESRPTNRSAKSARTYETEAESNFIKRGPIKKTFVRAHTQFSDYQYPKNDKVVSKGKTPKDKGARACRHCGSLNHWDYNHPFSGKDDRRAKAFLTVLDSEALEAYVAYENCYLEELDGQEEQFSLLSPVKEEENPQKFSEREDFPPSPA